VNNLRLENSGFDGLSTQSATSCMPCLSGAFSDVHWSPTSPSLQGLWFMRVHRGSHQFKIFADGIANIFNVVDHQRVFSRFILTLCKNCDPLSLATEGLHPYWLTPAWSAPSIKSSVPEQNEDSSLKKKSTAAATSSGRPKRPSGGVTHCVGSSPASG